MKEMDERQCLIGFLGGKACDFCGKDVNVRRVTMEAGCTA